MTNNKIFPSQCLELVTSKPLYPNCPKQFLINSSVEQEESSFMLTGRKNPGLHFKCRIHLHRYYWKLNLGKYQNVIPGFNNFGIT